MPTDEPRPPVDLPLGEPKAMIQQLGNRTRGFHAWSVWVDLGWTRYEHEWGSYASSEKAARRKALRLLRHYRRHHYSGPGIEVEDG